MKLRVNRPPENGIRISDEGPVKNLVERMLNSTSQSSIFPSLDLRKLEMKFGKNKK